MKAVNIAGSNNNYVVAPNDPPNIIYYADFDTGSGSISVPTNAWHNLLQNIGFRLDATNNVYVGTCGTFPDLTFSFADNSSKPPTKIVVNGGFFQPMNDPLYAATNECRTVLQPDDQSDVLDNAL